MKPNLFQKKKKSNLNIFWNQKIYNKNKINWIFSYILNDVNKKLSFNSKIYTFLIKILFFSINYKSFKNTKFKKINHLKQKIKLSLKKRNKS
jgi:hypothetical protein